VGIAHGHADVSVTSQRSNLRQWTARLNQAADESMAESVEADITQPGCLGSTGKRLADLVWAVGATILLYEHMFTIRVEETVSDCLSRARSKGNRYSQFPGLDAFLRDDEQSPRLVHPGSLQPHEVSTPQPSI